MNPSFAQNVYFAQNVLVPRSKTEFFFLPIYDFFHLQLVMRGREGFAVSEVADLFFTAVINAAPATVIWSTSFLDRTPNSTEINFT